MATLLFCAPLLFGVAHPAGAQRFDGFNVIVAPDHPFGTPSARRALAAARRLGASTVAIVPFFWQPDIASAEIVRGDDMSDGALRAAIRDARALGFSVVVKPHVWVKDSWAGAVKPSTEEAWVAWFKRYRHELTRLAQISAEEKAEAFAIGTELVKTTHRPEWREVIQAARAAFPRLLVYFAHNVDEAEAVPFWGVLDAIGVTLYPPLGADSDRGARLAAMRASAERLDALAARNGKQVIVGEIGLRSAEGAARKPWESAEEREAAVDLVLQAEVIADWLAVLDRPAIRGVLVWRWFTDPDAGGDADTDFTVQGKPAEGVLLCAWIGRCAKR
jgi:sugar phosphate isomerase/epimerase